MKCTLYKNKSHKVASLLNLIASMFKYWQCDANNSYYFSHFLTKFAFRM